MTRLRQLASSLLLVVTLLPTIIKGWSFNNSPTNNNNQRNNGGITDLLLFNSQNSRRSASKLSFSDENHGTGVKIFRSSDNDDDDSYYPQDDTSTQSQTTTSIEQDPTLTDPAEIMQVVSTSDSFFDNPTSSSSTDTATFVNGNSVAKKTDNKKKTKSDESNTNTPKLCESLNICDENTQQVNLIEPLTFEEDETQLSLMLETLLKWTPVFIPIVAFVLYDPTALLFSNFLQNLSSKENNWVAVDGGQYQARIITPAINGIVVQAIAILFAVLIGNTITNLRQRQTEICLQTNQEATQLRIMSNMIASYPSVETQQTCRQYLLQYTSRLIAEGHETTNVQALEKLSLNSQDTELYGILALLNDMNVDTTSVATGGLPVPTLLLDKSYETTFRLLDARSKRLTALSSTFPALHYVVIVMLAVSMCIAFLMETDQDILVFLNAIQLRLLWTSLVGTFCALGVVLYDLGQPFRGSYQVTKAVNQLYSIRSMLKRSIKDGNAVASMKSSNIPEEAGTPKAPSRKESVNGSIEDISSFR